MTRRFQRIRPTRRGFLAATGAFAAGISFLPRGTLAQEEPVLNFSNWDTYIGETTLQDFQEATGIAARMDLYADNDELFSKLREGNPGYDVIVPTNDFVERMIRAEMLMPLDHDKIPNIANIEERFMDAGFDPGRRYSLPYMWGTIGIGFRKSRMDEVPASWKWVFDSDRYSGKIGLLGDGLTVIGQALKYLGYSMNSKDPKEINEAAELIIAQKPHIKVFADDNGQDLLLSGEVDITQEWNGDILQVMEEDDDLDYVVPVEGGMLWEDCLCIPNGAPHPENAHKFINFLHDGEVMAAIADFIQFGTANSASKQHLGPEYLENPAIFPSEETLARCEPSVYLGEEATRLYDEAWTRIQAA